MTISVRVTGALSINSNKHNNKATQTVYILQNVNTDVCCLIRFEFIVYYSGATCFDAICSISCFFIINKCKKQIEPHTPREDNKMINELDGGTIYHLRFQVNK